MSRLSINLLLATTIFGNSVAAAPAETFVTVPTERELAAQVFVGDDRNMPIGQNFEVSIHPTVDTWGKIVIPNSIPAAFRELQKSLPHWFLNALIRSAGTHGCSVIFSRGGSIETDEMVLVENWIWINWNVNMEHSPLKREFSGLKLTNKFLITSAFRSGFCKFLKDGDLTAAMDEVASYRNP